ncbi:hypothetical protein Kpol_1061p25 [Vanderwaltozyma polyspora DSM 70294]|uniref:Ornithine cyclodeaminase n=1 Tax=Vanderwaltozyma polyspora (strain ATCC 22028 / DSM 70294 / BCRC 21397 / CBS 2163 / NBRC 10782 / NRRL Y-8283 / UCD 57-17) TaxID=436907 RepID=A7TJF1_VANPO|nr:uncharacterized protein Kpol_1061p25 [Vanderwaltozyma polyspora DSM 70294]EDO17601.1 hypothetical protein Kpol_1061p25 [Vanderwaltozyma polyspora DSM 70294]
MITVENTEIRNYFLNCSTDKLLEYINEIKNALKLFSDNHSIIPNRLVQKTPKEGVLHFYMPVIDDTYSGLKTLTHNEKSNKGFIGSIIVEDSSNGKIEGILDAKEVTGIRTAMASCIPILPHLSNYISHLDGNINIVVFGSGLQAFWHIYIVIKLFYPTSNFSYPDLKCINVTVLYRNRKMQLDELQDCLSDCPFELKFEQYNWENLSALQSTIDDANIIFGCVPSRCPVLYYKHLLPKTGSQLVDQYTYISLIGSYTPGMRECDNTLIQRFQALDAPIIVDSKSHSLGESGELIASNVKKNQLIEIGKLHENLELPKIAIANGHRKITLCKLVGLAIMDIAFAKKYIHGLKNSQN